MPSDDVGRARVLSTAGLDALVSRVRAEPGRRDELVPLLREDAPLHRRQPRSATARRRGWILATFAEVGLPHAAVPYVLEELTTGDEPYLIASAARAARSGGPEANAALSGALVAALGRIRVRDDLVSFAELDDGTSAGTARPASAEILDTMMHLEDAMLPALPALRALQDRDSPRWNASVRRTVGRIIRRLEAIPESGSCCHHSPVAPVASKDPSPAPEPLDLTIEFENHDGEVISLGELLRAPMNLVAFFYTRCTNPEKCSATITNLARLQAALAVEGFGPSVGITAVTYDPGYDTPARLRSYGEARGLRFSPTVHAVRCTRAQNDVARAFALCVGYNGSIVNRHAIELYLVDPTGAILETWTRVRWLPEDVLTTLRQRQLTSPTVPVLHDRPCGQA